MRLHKGTVTFDNEIMETDAFQQVGEGGKVTLKTDWLHEDQQDKPFADGDTFQAVVGGISTGDGMVELEVYAPEDPEAWDEAMQQGIEQIKEEGFKAAKQKAKRREGRTREDDDIIEIDTEDVTVEEVDDGDD